MISFKLGEKLPIELPDSEGGRIIFLGGTPLFVVGLLKPTKKEIHVMCDSKLTIGVAEYERLGVLLLEYEGGITFEPTFDVGLEASENLPNFTFSSDEDRILISIIGYDLEDDRVFSIRYCSLSPHVSRCFASIFERQSREIISREENYLRVNRLYSRIPTFTKMKEMALAMEKVGS